MECFSFEIEFLCSKNYELDGNNSLNCLKDLDIIFTP